MIADNVRDTMRCVQSPVTSPWTVFLVDDNPDDLALGQRVLKRSPDIGEIVCLASGKALFNELRARHFFYDRPNDPPHTLIMLDIHMPHENGLLLLEQLRISPYTERIPIVMLTGDCSTDNIETTYHMQANGYFTKPLREDHLRHLTNILKRGYDWNDIERLGSLFSRS